MADLTEQGGERYARMAALAYRQTLAGCGLAADANGKPLLFPKENTSNGCIATVDVIYPAAPQFLLMGPTYAKALVVPAMVYSAVAALEVPVRPARHRRLPAGQRPGLRRRREPRQRGRQDARRGERQPDPALRRDRQDGRQRRLRLARWWPQLTRWEAYLEKYGLDPENQLCTDDFMGHLAHNANLSVKAILAIAAYGDLCRMRGDAAAADKFLALARADARHWVEAAADGDHSPDRLRQAEHLEPEVQPRLGQAPRPERLPARGRPPRGRLLQEGDAALRRPARLPHQAHQDRLVGLERHDGRRPRPTSRRSSPRSTTT